MPCIIPSDAIQCLSFISNVEVREAVGIAKNNTYLFASTGICFLVCINPSSILGELVFEKETS